MNIANTSTILQLSTDIQNTLDASLLDAAKDGNASRVRMLLRLGADIGAKDDRRDITPIQLASSRGHANVVRVLLDNGADVDAEDVGFCSPLHEACRGGHVDVINVLIKEYGASVNGATYRYDAVHYTPLHSACQGAGQLEAAKALIRHGADVNANGKNGTPLHTFCLGSSKNIAFARTLLDNGADVQARGDITLGSARREKGCTPLHLACRSGRTELVKMLIGEYGADVSAETTGCRSTPLHCACDTGWMRDPALIPLLISRGADVHAVNKSGRTPLDCARSWYSYGPDYSALYVALEDEVAREPARPSPLATANVDGTWSQSIKGSFGSDDLPPDCGISPLDFRLRFVTMSKHGNLSEVRWLLQQGANVNINKEHRLAYFYTSPLMNASRNGHIQMAKLLLENGADINSTDSFGRTPLHHAFGMGHMDVVDLLIENGADANAKDTWYETGPVYYGHHGRDPYDCD